MKLLTIIVTYRGKQWYDRCFASLLQSILPVDIFVVDNASGDGSAEYIREHYPTIHLVESERNLGFGQANNLGLRYALDNGYDYVFLLNQDAWLHNADCMNQLVQVAEQPEYHDYMIFSALWLYAKADRLTKGTPQHLTKLAKRGEDFVSDLFFQRPLLPLYTTDYIGAAAWLLPRRTLETIGGFDPLFFHRGEDDNYMQRVHFHGGKIGICPYAQICHDIEERSEGYDAEHENWQKNMLIELANINNPLTLEQWRRTYLIQALKQYTYGAWKKGRKNWQVAQFIARQQEAVQQSKFHNQQKGPNWL